MITDVLCCDVRMPSPWRKFPRAPRSPNRRDLRVAVEMRKLNVKTLVLILALCFAATAQEKSTTPESRPALTIYNQNFFVAREHLPLDLKSGVNHVDFTGIDRAPRARLRHPARSHRTRPADPRAELPQRSRLAGTAALVLRGQDARLPGAAERQVEEIVKGKIIRSGYVPSSATAEWLPAAAPTAADHRSRRHPALRTCPASRCFPRSPETPS